MKRAAVLADRTSILAFRLIAAVNVLFLLTFLALLAFATSTAHADAQVCTGKDMMAEMRAADPALAARVEREASATLNGRGLLWKVETAGVTPSYLFGTMHMTDPRVTTLTPVARQAFDAAGTVVIETTEILNQTEMVATLARNPDLMMFTDGTTLMSLLSPDDQKALEKGLAERGILLAAVSKMKPWMLSAMVAMPACELSRKAAGAPILDVKLAEEARSANKRLEGLETIADQLGAMASLPMQLHLKGLVDTLRLGDRIDDVVETMIVLYARGDVGTIWPLFRAVLPGTAEDQAGYAAFEQAMIVERNKTMVRNAEPILEDGNAFIAVGALHLPGPDGLIELLRGRGHTVIPVD